MLEKKIFGAIGPMNPKNSKKTQSKIFDYGIVLAVMPRGIEIREKIELP
jgi:hypothetical protein